MACAIKKEQTIKLEAAQVYWGKEQCRVVKMVADDEGSLSGQYFDLTTINPLGVTTQYYVLFDNGSAVDPEPAGKTKIEVLYSDDDSASTLAGLLNAALSAIEGLSSGVVGGDSVHYQNKWIGFVSESFTNAPDLDFEVLQGIGGFLGRTSEGIEVTIETQSAEITSNQTGEIILDEIGQGQAANCSASFIELSKERLEAMIAGAVGGTHTPVGGTKLIGGGSSKIFQSLKELGGKLILHPQRLPLTDRSEDFIFWKSAPKPESINYSGTDVQALAVTFNAYLDDSKPVEINLFAIGDWTQLQG
jgi:hypothetical protein